MTAELRVGIFGAGMIAGVHARAYAATAGTTVVAVSDPVASKAQELAGSAGAETVPDLAAMIELGVDVVSVCTPPPTHADLAVAALEAGLHVLCEKPIGRTLADARRIVAADEASLGLLMVGQVSRFEPDHRQAKTLVADGMIGAPQMAKHSITTSVPGWSEGGWLGDPAVSGGPLVDLSVHSFDFLSWIFDSPAVRVTAVSAAGDAGPYVLTTVRYASGAMGLVECSWAHPVARGFKLEAEIIGTDGRLDWDYDHLMGGVMYPTEGYPVWHHPVGERGFSHEVQAFRDAIHGRSPSPVPGRAGLEALRTALAAQESIDTSRTIDLTTWETS